MRTSRVLAMTLLIVGAACHRAPRCATCGMKIDPSSPWVAYLETTNGELAFDTPHCALRAWHLDRGHVRSARFRDYYSQELKNADDLRFVRGSDVLSPMGQDLVPVASANANRFARDHNGAPPASAREVVEEGEP
jgi:hypothetical protein